MADEVRRRGARKSLFLRIDEELRRQLADEARKSDRSLNSASPSVIVCHRRGSHLILPITTINTGRCPAKRMPGRVEARTRQKEENAMDSLSTRASARKQNRARNTAERCVYSGRDRLGSVVRRAAGEYVALDSRGKPISTHDTHIGAVNAVADHASAE
jgi:hypothetical protein